MGFPAALRSVRAAKNWLLLAIIVCLLVQLAGFVMVHFMGFVDEAGPVVALKNAAATTTQPVSADEDSTLVFETLKWVLALTKFGALVAAGLLSLTLLLTVNLSLLGRLGGPAGFLGAFFWSLVLLAVLIPWRSAVKADLMCSATFNLGHLMSMAKDVKTSWGAATPDWATVAFYYARFLVYPALAVLIALVVAARFSGGYRPIKQQVKTVIGPAHETPEEPEQTA